MPKIAIIMCVYHKDKPEHLMLSLESMFSQTYSKLDVFLYCDGKLTESHLDIIRNFSIKNKLNIVKGKQPKGLAYGLNHLIDIILTYDYDFIARMDSDDFSRPERIERQMRFLITNPDIDVCGTSCHEFGSSFALNEKHLPRSHDELLKFSITRCPFIHPTVMFRANVFKSGIRYPTHTTFTEDMALWLSLLDKGFKFSNINEVLLDYRMSEDTVKRRKGINKAISEMRLRFYYMFKLRAFSLKSFTLIISRLFLHLLPTLAMKLAYKKIR